MNYESIVKKRIDSHDNTAVFLFATKTREKCMPTNENSSSDRRSFIGKGSLVALTAALASSSASAQEQANLSSLQEKLRTDSELRNRFAQDPGSILSANGIKLNADQIANLKKQLDAAKIGQTGNPQAVSVGITVGN